MDRNKDHGPMPELSGCANGDCGEVQKVYQNGRINVASNDDPRQVKGKGHGVREHGNFAFVDDPPQDEEPGVDFDG